jgi:membrane protein DedA with SNARE-associated domain
MYPQVTTTKQERTRLRTALLALAGIRGVLAAVAIPLAPVLYRRHFMVLVFLRPTKDVLLAAGFLGRRQEVHLSLVVLTAIPLAVFGVWIFFWLGRSFGPEIRNGKLPGWARRILPKDRINDMCKVLDKRGDKVVIIGRLAAFPSTLMAAAAGASGMDTKQFLKADAIGALLSIAEVVGAGYLLGSAYKHAGPWLTAVGVAMLFGGMFYVGRMLRRT